MKKLLLSITLIGLIATSVFSQESPDKNFLFVGNSYTYFWNLPQCIEAMGESRKLNWEMRQSTAGGVNWGQHIRGEKKLQTVDKIEKGDFDVIVLQNHSLSSFRRPDSMFHFGQMLVDQANKKGAKVYLYLTWAREWDSSMQQGITEQYKKLSKKFNVGLVPVGLAWERARQLKPGFPLYDEDGSHPSPLGTYLTACVFYGVFSGESPVGLPKRLSTKDRNGEKLYLNIQSAENALFCQKVAAEIISKLEN
ncbi:MAG: hypothetical protein AAFY71_04805 [Bacteroidota bacterium]